MFEAQQKFLKENQYRYFLVEPHWMYPMHSTLVENQTSQLKKIYARWCCGSARLFSIDLPWCDVYDCWNWANIGSVGSNHVIQLFLWSQAVDDSHNFTHAAWVMLMSHPQKVYQFLLSHSKPAHLVRFIVSAFGYNFYHCYFHLSHNWWLISDES